MLNEDYRDMLQILLENKVKFLVVGAYSMAVYGYPRATGDIDIWVEASKDNSEKVYHSLVEFGALVSDLTPDTFSEEDVIFQIGVAPRRIDVITSINGVDFVDAFPNRKEVLIDSLNIPFISKEDLIKNKESTGREKDLLDVKILRKKHDS